MRPCAGWGNGFSLCSKATLSLNSGRTSGRARFMAESMGASLGVLQSVKDALDPSGILNPGKLGLSSPFGEVGWP